MIRSNAKSLALLISLAVVAGCTTTGGPPPQPGSGTVDQSGGGEVYGGDGSGGVSSSDMTEEERRAQAAEATREEQASMRKVTTFYFDFDTSEIKAESRDILIAHARFLNENPSRDVRLEGHSDERGTTEYNLALGERRAKAVQRFLVVNGASRDQIETISFGEEKPTAMGDSESAWAQNRRVELIYQ